MVTLGAGTLRRGVPGNPVRSEVPACLARPDLSRRSDCGLGCVWNRALRPPSAGGDKGNRRATGRLEIDSKGSGHGAMRLFCLLSGRLPQRDRRGGNRTLSRRRDTQVWQNSFCLDKDFSVAEMSYFWPCYGIIFNLLNHGNVAIIYCLDNNVLHGTCISSGSKTVGLRGSLPLCSSLLDTNGFAWRVLRTDRSGIRGKGQGNGDANALSVVQTTMLLRLWEFPEPWDDGIGRAWGRGGCCVAAAN